MGTHSNILIIGKLTIGNNVTLASRVTIIYHSHGKLDETDIDVPVMERALISKGPIYIADNVWIGEGAVILGSITIGKNSIVGANAVVTKDVPPYSIVGGIPAKIIRIIPH
jgi:acetyltransferase-like isoleucine patch superfamily enzyme